MTTDRAPAIPGELRRWAAELLEIAAEAPPEQSRIAAARKLAEWDFTPPDRWQHAAELLTMKGTDRAAADSLRESETGSRTEQPALVGRQRPLAEVEHRLRQEIEDFAAGYFRQPPGDRSRNWHALRLRAGPFPLLLDRLAWLEHGLSATPEAVVDKDPQVARLAREAAEMYVLSPPGRAARRDELLRAKRLEAAKWAKAAKGLRSRHAALAALDGPLFDALEDRRKQQRQARKLAQPAGRSAQSGGMFEGHAWKYILAFWILLGCARACNHTSTRRPTPTPYRVPTEYRLPTPPIRLRSEDLPADGRVRRLLDVPPDAGGKDQPP